MQSWAKAVRRIYFVRHIYNGGGQKKKTANDTNKKIEVVSQNR